MIRKRTIVGSLPRRRQLRGREAVERALAHAMFYGTHRMDVDQLAGEGHGAASKASERAYEARLKSDPQHSLDEYVDAVFTVEYPCDDACGVYRRRTLDEAMRVVGAHA